MRLLFLVCLACTPTSKGIVGEDGASRIDAMTVSDAAVPDAAPDALDASDPDACVPGDTWDARIEVKAGSLDVVVPRSGQRKAVYAQCRMAGGGCGCDRSNPASLACDVTPAHAHVEIGTDDVSTSVNLLQKGDTIVADWTWGEFPGTQVSHKSEVLVKLPCAVKVRFVR